MMKPRSEPVEVSSGALIVQEAACKKIIDVENQKTMSTISNTFV